VLDRRSILRSVGLAGVGSLLPAGLLARSAPARSSRFTWQIQRPETAGLSRAGLDGMRAAVQKHIDSPVLSGAVTAVARHNCLAWYEAQGLRDVETRASLRTDDIFRLASSTKPVTAVCILMLMDAGKLSIDDRVSRFIPTFRNPKVAQLPEGAVKQPVDYFTKREELQKHVKFVPASREITLKELLTHTAGLSSIFSLTTFPEVKIERTMTLAERIPKLGALPLDFEPGSRWAYSPLDGFDVLGHIVEIVSGMPLDVFMKRRIFDPLGMVDTGFHMSAAQRERLVPLYQREKDGWKPRVDLIGAGDPDTKYLFAAGGLVSTARDYLLFQQMLLNRGELNGRRLLSAEAVTLMSTNHVGALFEQTPLMGRRGWGFGLGVGIVVDPVAAGVSRGRGSFGWDGAYGTDGWVDRENDLAVSYFVQQEDKRPLREFETAIAKALVW